MAMIRVKDELYAKLQALADKEKRSITKQLEVILEKELEG